MLKGCDPLDTIAFKPAHVSSASQPGLRPPQLPGAEPLGPYWVVQWFSQAVACPGVVHVAPEQ
jgi:hypothetical protein